MTPRQEAKAQGLTHYFTSKPCKHGHVSERQVSNGCCCQCQQTPEAKAYYAKYNKLNAEQIATQKAAYRVANLEKVKAQQAASYKANHKTYAAYYAKNAQQIATQKAAYRVANLEKMRAYDKARSQEAKRKEATRTRQQTADYKAIQAAYIRANRAHYTALAAKRRAAKHQQTPSWADFEAIKGVYRLCAEKTKATGIKHAVDHVYPLQGMHVSGLHVAANLQIITASENSRKSNRMPAPEQVPSDLE